jgi:hypothetical protein
LGRARPARSRSISFSIQPLEWSKRSVSQTLAAQYARLFPAFATICSMLAAPVVEALYAEEMADCLLFRVTYPQKAKALIQDRFST